MLLASLLLSFLFIRTSARMNRSPRFAWWPAGDPDINPEAVAGIMQRS